MSKAEAITKGKEIAATIIAAEAVELLNTGHPDKAIKLFEEKALENLPNVDLPKAKFNMAIAYQQLGEIGKMIQALEEANKLGYDNGAVVNLYFYAGTELQKKGDHATAEKILSDLSKNPICPDDLKIDVFARLAETQQAQGNNATYIKSLEDAVAAYEAAPSPKFSELAFSAYNILGKDTLDQTPLAGVKVSDTNTLKKLYAQAKGYFTEAMKIHDNNHALLNNLGLAEKGLHEYTEAQAHIAQAFDLEANPIYSENLTGLVTDAALHGVDLV